MTEPTRLEQVSGKIDCLAIVEAVSKHEGTAPSSLDPPLYEAVEPDALETLLNGTGSAPDSPVTIRFEYAGYRIAAGSDGSLDIDRSPNRSPETV